MSEIGTMDAGMEDSWFSVHDWDVIFNNSQDADWCCSTELDVDFDLDVPLDDLIIQDISINNLSRPEDLQDVIDADLELHDKNNNMEKDVISSPGRDRIVFQCPVDCTVPIIIEHPAVAGDQLVSNCSDKVTNSSGKSKSIETDKGGSPSVAVDHGTQLEDMDYKGLRLLHLLTACAEAVSQEEQDLVVVILSRLRELVSPTGSTMERVAYYLLDALPQSNENSLAHLEPNDKSTKEHFLGALKLLNVAYPYIRIPHFTANECILEAVAAVGGANVGIHIIDFDIMEGTQWPPLMAALRNNRNYHVGHLKITSIKWAEDDCLLYSGHTGRRLTECASSVGIPFLFQERDLEGLKELLPQEGEIVIVNCVWQLPHMVNLRSKSQLVKFLVAARHLNPVALTLATGPHGTENDTADFLDSFARRLNELCTIFDSLEAGLPDHGLARAMLERIFFGPAMSRRVMGTAYGNDSPPEYTIESNVVDLPLKCGYAEVSISDDNVMYAKYTLLCSGGSRSYEVELVGHHRLVLKWASTGLVWVSAWRSP